MKSQVRCSVCRTPGHNKRTCPTTKTKRTPRKHQPAKVPLVPHSSSCSPPKYTCSICYDDLDTNVNYVSTPCKHVYCFECLSKHLQNDSRCPMCRKDLVVGDKPTRQATLQSPPPQRYNWNQFVVTMDDGSTVPLSQFIPVDMYEEFLQDISSLDQEEAVAIINRVVREEYVA
jgi:hypothetical protein